MTRHSPAQQLKEARQIAHDHGMTLVVYPTRGGADYVVYRQLPDGHRKRLGMRSTIPGVRRYVARLADIH